MGSGMEVGGGVHCVSPLRVDDIDGLEVGFDCRGGGMGRESGVVD